MKKVGPALTSIVLGTLAIALLYSGKEGYFIESKQETKVTESHVMELKKEQKEELKIKEEPKVEVVKVEATPEPTPTPDPIVYDGLTMNELGAKLDRSLHSTLSGYGSVFANQAISLGIDPYVSVAIVLLETGCKWNCSTLLKECNNVGGMKGSPGCNGGSYKAFSTLEEGIQSYLQNLYYNYYRVGLTTPELIGPKYAESAVWARDVNAYINEIKAS